MTRSRERLVLAVALVVLAATLVATRIDGVFTIDENSYLATVTSLRAGRLSVPGTEGLPPSPELLSFDAAPRFRSVTSTPVASSSPPLYAFVALPFSLAGWAGLVALQALSFAALIWIAFETAALHARRRGTPWLAAAAVGAGGYLVEYAQGVWPHALAACLCAGAFHLVVRALASGRMATGMCAGLLAGLATGIRYQNLVFAVVLGLAVLLLGRASRLRATAGFALGLALPLLLCSAINARRLGTWNPVSKGPAYFAALETPRENGGRLRDALTSTWMRIVDPSVQPAPPYGSEQSSWLRKEWRTGSFLVVGTLKKALLQSAPWALLGLAGLALAWRRAPRVAPPQRVALRAASLVVAAVVALFAAYGYRRHDGLCFNERYLLELVPLLAVAFAWVLDEVDLRWRALLLGAAVAGGALALTLALEPELPLRLQVLAWVPLALAVLCVLAVLAQPHRAHVACALAGACIGWALAAHLGDDLPASRSRRAINARLLDDAERVLPRDDRSALVAFGAFKDPFGPLLLSRDLVIVDPWIDDERDTARLVRAFIDQGRDVYFFDVVPRTITADLFRDVDLRRVPTPRMPMFRASRRPVDSVK